jgi:hypothetical protein
LQVKNSLRAANALANFDKSNSFITHLQTAFDAGRVFEEAFKGTGKLDNVNDYL